MRAIDPEETRQIDREKRIEELRRRAKDAGCQMLEGKIEKCPPELEESFWEHVAAWDEAPWTTNLQQLEKAGIHLPSPEQLDDLEISAQLWQLIERLALSVFLEDTNHLSDREHYTFLRAEGLREETKDLAGLPGTVCHLSPIGSGSEEDTFLLSRQSGRRWTIVLGREDMTPRHVQATSPPKLPFGGAVRMNRREFRLWREP